MAKITVQNTEVNVVKLNGKDYICLKNMLHPDFNYGEFATIRNFFSGSKTCGNH